MRTPTRKLPTIEARFTNMPPAEAGLQNKAPRKGSSHSLTRIASGKEHLSIALRVKPYPAGFPIYVALRAGVSSDAPVLKAVFRPDNLKASVGFARESGWIVLPLKASQLEARTIYRLNVLCAGAACEGVSVVIKD